MPYIENKPLLYKYMNDLSLFGDSKCKNCLLFPVCTGGCAWYRSRNTYEGANFDLCSLFVNKEDLEDCLLSSLNENERNGRVICP